MKVSELIKYLEEYRLANGDVDIDVEFGGNPKTPPPGDTQVGSREQDISKLFEHFRKMEDEKNKSKIYPKWNDDWKKADWSSFNTDDYKYKRYDSEYMGKWD